MKTVVVFGTFDIVHAGHLSFFRQAKHLGDRLIVVVARDHFVKQLKGFNPRPEKVRAANIRRQQIADKVVLGSKTHNFYRTLRRHEAGVLALGYDQKQNIWHLKRALKKHRLNDVKIVRLRGYKPEIYKTSKMKAVSK